MECRIRSGVDDCIRFGIQDTVIVSLVLTVLFEAFAKPLASLFGLAGGTTEEIITVCTRALRVASVGFIFMGISVAIQGVLRVDPVRAPSASDLSFAACDLCISCSIRLYAVAESDGACLVDIPHRRGPDSGDFSLYFEGFL